MSKTYTETRIQQIQNFINIQFELYGRTQPITEELAEQIAHNLAEARKPADVQKDSERGISVRTYLAIAHTTWLKGA